MKLSLDTIIQRNADQLFSTIDDEVVMLSISNGEYYNLNQVGSYIWLKLKTPISLYSLVKILCNTYDIEEFQCTQDTIIFIEKLIEKEIVKIENE